MGEAREVKDVAEAIELLQKKRKEIRKDAQQMAFKVSHFSRCFRDKSTIEDKK
ncbi:hypothetical protein HQQ94_18660 [Shewanella sp. VB17]|uniref:hypothetical protein n=1 Tax=Shewanella sp. VB17 TaxID=2739432 RepID=UPI0015675F9D|nr:hypothetical protein [Shewanella sp. VB17]NRD75206.1 hypothetical protein [Shewanella sp. VB17]